MNIEKLKSGQTYKNYKALCETLEIPVKKANSRKAQLRELDRYCLIQTIGHQIIIKEVYDTPKEKTENRGKSEGSRNNNNVYGEFLQFVIADIAKNSKKGSVSFSRGRLMLAANMVNCNYQWGNQNVGKLSEYTSIDEAVIYDFYDTSDSNLTSAINSALKSLESKRVIFWERSVKVKPLAGDLHRRATEQEKRLILYYENEALRSTTYKTIEEVRVSKDWREFKRSCDKTIRENVGIEYYYLAYDITFNQEHVSIERDNLMKLISENYKSEEYREKLNSAIMSKFRVNAQLRHENAFSNKKKGKYRIDINYTNQMDTLISLLIDSKTEDIKSKVNDKHQRITENLKMQVNNEMDFLFG
ncbi:hypothetical protein [Priestia megaterium]|uniref:hypothetical protein n=1 Tax=Priestia megaterium TaxID=1404 RepID=UPI00287759E0|nr:hypothetical protein [Priestia megaterium]